MSKTLYLHIGMHKTGTTALQKFFSLNSEVLADQGFCYPKSGRSGPALAHHDIANSLKGPPFPLRKPERAVDEYLADIRNCFGMFPDVLLSSEIFMRFVPAFRDHLGLKLSDLDRLASTADSVRVIIYLRRQDEYLESFYSQEIQHDLSMGFADFVEARLPDYFSLCQQLADFFGKSNVIARVYDRRQFSGGSLFSDALCALGVKQTVDFATPGQDINPSLGPDEREFKRIVNALDISIGDLVRFNEPLLKLSREKRAKTATSSDSPALFSPAQRNRLLQECAETNRRVAEEFVRRVGTGDALFSLPSVHSRDGQAACTGLSKETLGDIISYLQRSWPELAMLLSGAIKKGLASEDQAAQKAAGKLQQAFV